MDHREACELSDLNYLEAVREQTRMSGGAVWEEDGILLAAGPHANPFVNFVLRTDPRVDPQDVLNCAARFFRDRGHAYTLITRATAEDGALTQAASGAGLTELLSPPAMILERRPEDRPPPEGVTIRRVTDAAGIADMASVAARSWVTYGIPPEVPEAVFAMREAFRAPHIAVAVAYSGDSPISGALVLLSHGIAGIYWVSTPPEQRGRGLGEACTRAVTNIGFDLGARLVSLQASPMGDPIYRRMGFVEVFRYRMLAAT